MTSNLSARVNKAYMESPPRSQGLARDVRWVANSLPILHYWAANNNGWTGFNIEEMLALSHLRILLSASNCPMSLLSTVSCPHDSRSDLARWPSRSHVRTACEGVSHKAPHPTTPHHTTQRNQSYQMTCD